MDNSYPTPWIRATSVMTNTRLSNSTPQAFLFHKVCFPLLTFRHHEIAPLRLNRPQKLRQSSSSISSLSNFYNCFTPLGRKTPSFNLLNAFTLKTRKTRVKKNCGKLRDNIFCVSYACHILISVPIVGDDYSSVTHPNDADFTFLMYCKTTKLPPKN